MTGLTIILLVLLTAGCIDQKPKTETVLVNFEIQLINARANSYSYGIENGDGETGFGATNEVIRWSTYAKVGQKAFAWVRGSQFSSREPGHQVLCRIIVNNKNIYLAGDQGTMNEDTLAECGGPVYIPNEDGDER
jgi:hypothetical protein